MVEAERVDVSLKENDVKNRRSLPIPNHSFPRMTPQPPERTPPTHLVAATEGVCLVRSCRNDAFFCDLASDRLYSWKNGLAPTSHVSVVAARRNARCLRNGAQNAKGDASGSPTPISQESVVAGFATPDSCGW